MKRIILHIACYFVLLINALPVMLPVSLAFQKWLVQHKMQEKLETENLQIVRVDKNGIQWRIQNRECIIGNRLFDVKSIVEENGVLIIEGIYDDEEKAIESRLTKSMTPLDDELSLVIHKYLDFFAVRNTVSNPAVDSQFLKKRYKTCAISLFIAPGRNITTPPPEV